MSDDGAKETLSKNVLGEGLNGLRDKTEGTITSIDPEFEHRTLRKFDKWLLPPLIVILLVAYLDRSNLGKFTRTA
jgi:hypothetical protein